LTNRIVVVVVGVGLTVSLFVVCKGGETKSENGQKKTFEREMKQKKKERTKEEERGRTTCTAGEYQLFYRPARVSVLLCWFLMPGCCFGQG